MKVTKVQLAFPNQQQGNRPNNPNHPFRAFAKIVLDDVLMVTGIRLFEKKIGDHIERSILFPDKQPSLFQTAGEYVSIAIVNTIDPELRTHIRDSVFEAFDRHPRNPKNAQKNNFNNNAPTNATEN